MKRTELIETLMELSNTFNEVEEFQDTLLDKLGFPAIPMRKDMDEYGKEYDKVRRGKFEGEAGPERVVFVYVSSFMSYIPVEPSITVNSGYGYDARENGIIQTYHGQAWEDI